MSMTRKFVLFFAVLVLTACDSSPSEGDIQTAIVKTQQANNQVLTVQTKTLTIAPSQTRTPTFTITSTSTPEPTNTETPTSTSTPSPTPDLRIISGDPEDYILQKDDLPNKYILYPGDSTPHENSEILSARGTEDGKAYLAATGRIKGWIIWYGLNDPTA
ncbi:MAG: hypothetical protein ABIG63_12575, partial [Chloroflexota bacterium]